MREQARNGNGREYCTENGVTRRLSLLQVYPETTCHLLAALAICVCPQAVRALEPLSREPARREQQPLFADSEARSFAEFIARLGDERDMQASPASGFEHSAACGTPFSASFPVLGVQKTAVILIDVAGDGAQQPPEDIRYAMFESAYSIASFIDEVSYGLASLTGDVFG